MFYFLIMVFLILANSNKALPVPLIMFAYLSDHHDNTLKVSVQIIVLKQSIDGFR
mgnify:CR=1 FL=1